MKSINKIKWFRIGIIALVGIIILISGFNVFLSVRTPFSGTTYLPLPSNFYINQKFQAKLSNPVNPEQIYETIDIGCFVIAVNNTYLDSLYDKNDKTPAFDKFKRAVENSPDSVIVKILVNKNAVFDDELIVTNYYRKQSQDFIISKTELSKLNITFISDAIYLGFIEQGGATYRAGIKKGDILMAVNGEKWRVEYSPDQSTYKLDNQSLYKLRSNPIGKPIIYEVIRGGETKSFEVRLAAFGIPIKFLIMLILGLVFIFIGWFLAYKNSDSKGSRLTGLWMILIGFNSAVSMIMAPPDMSVYALIMVLLKILVPLLALPLILHSMSYFPAENTKIISKRRIKYSIFIPFWIYAILVAISIIFQIQILPYYIYHTVLFGVIIYYGILRIIFRKYDDKRYSSVPLIQYFIFFLVILVLESPQFLWYIGIRKGNFLLENSFLVMALIPAFYIYLISKFRLFDIGIRIKRSVQYNFVTIIWHVAIIASVVIIIKFLSDIDLIIPTFKISGTNIEFLSLSADSEFFRSFEKILFAVVSIIIVLLSIKFAKTGQEFLDRKFYRQKFDYKFAQKELLYLIQTKLTFSDLAVLIVGKLKDLVHLKSVGVVFFKKEDDLSGSNVYCHDSEQNKSLCLTVDKNLYTLINQQPGAFSVKRLPDEIQSSFLKNNYEYIFPVKSKNRLLGALFIGEKLSETEMKDDDFEFLSSISSNFAVAIENAFLYEELTKQERLKHELDIARKIQLASLPQKVPQIKGLDIFGVSHPALEVGGDFYDFYNGHSDKFTIVVGDVSGKGTSAALYVSKVQGILRTLNEFDLSPKELFVRTNRLIYRNIESKSYITAIGANFDSTKNEISISRAGHLPLVKYNSSTKIFEKILPKGIGLGLTHETSFGEMTDEIKLNLKSGDIFVFISDGITEARNQQNQEFGFERIESILEPKNILHQKNYLS